MARASVNDSSYFQMEGSMRLSPLFGHEFDSARQLQAHRRYPVELGVPAHIVSDFFAESTNAILHAGDVTADCLGYRWSQHWPLLSPRARHCFLHTFLNNNDDFERPSTISGHTARRRMSDANGGQRAGGMLRVKGDLILVFPRLFFHRVHGHRRPGLCGGPWLLFWSRGEMSGR